MTWMLVGSMLEKVYLCIFIFNTRNIWAGRDKIISDSASISFLKKLLFRYPIQEVNRNNNN